MTDSSPECLWLDHLPEAVGANALTTMPMAYPAVLQLSGMDSAIRPLNEEQMARAFLYELLFMLDMKHAVRNTLNLTTEAQAFAGSQVS
ncbi:hypothetical protein D3C86_854120 [compost metagenome]